MRSETHMTQNLIYRAPEPSRASRAVVRRSKASLRGSMIAKLPAFDRPRVIQFESMLEYRFLCLMLVRDDVHDIQEQPPAVQYRRADGNPTSHVFDFLVTLTNGDRIAVAIKPSFPEPSTAPDVGPGLRRNASPHPPWSR